MTKKLSVKQPVRLALAQDKKARENIGARNLTAPTQDSFVNFSHKLGIGADNVLSSSTYGFNPLTRNRVMLEWMHRGSWIAGQVIDVVADDMTREGAEIGAEMEPDDQQAIERTVTKLGIWDALNETVKWGRLYGGCIAVHLVDGQDPRTPLRMESIGRGQYKGLAVLDRWMLEPSLEDLVTEYGPFMGLPKYYRVQADAPCLRGAAIHYTRVALRHDGVQMPYQQRLTENLWGISVLERLYDRMVAFDGASTGLAQLIFKIYLRTMKIDDLRGIVAGGGAPMQGLTAYMELMRRYQGIEGITLIDKEDDFEVQQHSALSGVGDALLQLGQQLSGATGIPLVRLFGQSPAGLNSTGESDIRNYYDTIAQAQNKTMHRGVGEVYEAVGRSEGIEIPDDFCAEFCSLWQMDDKEKSEIGKNVAEAVGGAFDRGIIGRQTSLRELRQASRVTGMFSNITSEQIDAADDEVMPPSAEMAMGQEHDEHMATLNHKQALEKQTIAQKHAAELAKKEKTNASGSNGQKEPVAGKQRRRALLQ